MDLVQETRSIKTGLLRGALGRCPNCGKGHLFRAYLKVQPTCEVCGHDLDHYRADDGPAYFTILLVGHLVILPMLFSKALIWGDPLTVTLSVSAVLIATTLVVLPRVKGAFIGSMWAMGAGAAQ